MCLKQCCTSDITLQEFKSLCGKMDNYNPAALTAEDFLKGTSVQAPFRTDLYSSCGTLVTNAESIALIKRFGRKHTPELKAYTPGPGMPSYDAIRSKLIQNYIDNGVDATMVFPQSIVYADILFWIRNFPEFGKQAVYSDSDGNLPCDGTLANCVLDNQFAQLASEGVKYLAPQMNVLVDVENGSYVPSQYAIAAKAAGFKIITWTLERSGFLKQGKSNVGGLATNVGVTGYNGGGYYSTSNGGSDTYPVGLSTAGTVPTMRQYFPSLKSITDNDGDVYELLHMLATKVGIVGMFSDWPVTVTFYANCILNAQRNHCSAKSTPAADPMTPLSPAQFPTSGSPMYVDLIVDVLLCVVVRLFVVICFC